MFRENHTAVRNVSDIIQHMKKFPHISRPVILLKDREHLGAQFCRAVYILKSCGLQMKLNEFFQVLFVCPQRRQFNHNGGKAVE